MEELTTKQKFKLAMKLVGLYWAMVIIFMITFIGGQVLVFWLFGAKK